MKNGIIQTALSFGATKDKRGITMPTISFFQNVVIEDEKKINEVRNALNSNTRPCSKIKNIDTNEDEQRKIAQQWYSNLKK